MRYGRIRRPTIHNEETDMTTNSRRCPICKSETAPARLTSLSGEDAPLAVTVKGMPVLECTQGHRLFRAG